MTTEQLERLWDAINRYAVACGGDPSKHVHGNTARQAAVTDVSRVIRDATRDAIESEGIELCRCLNCGCPPSSHAQRTTYGVDGGPRECLECECARFEDPTPDRGDDDRA